MKRILALLALCTATLCPAWAAIFQPVADAGPDRNLYTGVATNLVGQASEPNGLSIELWLWSVDTAPVDGAWVLQGETSPYASFSATKVGDYSLALLACDFVSCSEPDYVAIQVRDNLSPLAHGIASASTISVGQTVCFDGSSSSDPEGGPFTAVWDFGDGFQVDGLQACHPFDFIGTFDVRLVVTDERLARGSDDLTITVTRAVPEPGATMLVLLGCAALAWGRRSRIRSQVARVQV